MGKENSICTFYLVRHAESEANVKQIFGGNYPLTQKGIEQANARANELKPVHFDLVFSSDLLRARHTAEILALEHKLVIEAKKVLRERHYGSWEGKTVAEIEKTFSHYFKQLNTLAQKEYMISKSEPQQENGEEVIGRVITFMREIALAYPGKNILIVTHGDVMHMLLIHLGWATFSERETYSIHNTGYMVIQTDGVEFEILKTAGINKPNL